MKSAFSIALAAAMFAATPAAAAKYKIKWMLGHPNLDYFEEAAESFKKTVEAGSGGDISVELVTAENEALDALSPAQSTPEIAAKVARGEAEMGHSFTDVMGGLDRRFLAFQAPYLFRGYRHLEGVFEGPVGAGMLDGLRDHGIVGLSFTYSGGLNGVAARGRELRSAADLRGLKVGCFGDEASAAWLKSLGATPVTIKHRRASVIPLTDAGDIDAVVITWRNFERAGLHSRYKHFGLAGSSYLVSVTYINQKFFESLPPKHRELLARAARESGRIERAKTIELNETAKREMLAKGVRPTYLSEADRAKLVKALAPVYSKKLPGIIGADLLRSLRAVEDSPIHPVVPGEVASR